MSLCAYYKKLLCNLALGQNYFRFNTLRLFLKDLSRKPAAMRRLAGRLGVLRAEFGRIG